MTSTTTTLLRGLFFPTNGPVAPVALDAARLLDEAYAAIGCDMVDIIPLDLGVDLWCDDEALLKHPAVPNRAWAIRRRNNVYAQGLFGHVICLGRTETGDARSLTVAEADDVLGRVVGASAALIAQGDARPDLTALDRWLSHGVDWRT
jgi:Domain of unknown function (DUF3846)